MSVTTRRLADKIALGAPVSRSPGPFRAHADALFRFAERRFFALHGAVIAACIVSGAIISVMRGQDVNFDQLNYHYYSAYAYVTGRLARDVAPAHVIHSYFSPFVYLPFYYMVQHLPPRIAGMGLGALHGLNFWLVFVIAGMVSRPLAPAARVVTIGSAVAISAAGPMTASEFGTSLADIVTSLPVLSGVALLMHAEYDETRRAWSFAPIFLAGVFVGAAVSLKLTCASYAIGLEIAALVGWRCWHHRLLAILATTLGGILGFALIGGSWYLTMWRLFRNPVFPLFNSIFRSADYPVGTSFHDLRFLPHTVLQAISYPFLWVLPQHTTTEFEFRDIRFAVLIMLGAIALAAWLVGSRPAPRTATRGGGRLIAFMAAAFCAWMYEWSIQRYIVGLELLTGPAVVVILQWSGLFAVARGRAVAAIAAAFAVACLVTVQPIDWGHIAWSKSWYMVDVPPGIDRRATFIIDGAAPLSFTVPALPPQSPVIGIVAWENLPAWGDTVFSRRIQAILSDPAHREIWAVASGPLDEDFKKRVAQYGLRPQGACQTTASRPMQLTWCKLSRRPASG